MFTFEDLINITALMLIHFQGISCGIFVDRINEAGVAGIDGRIRFLLVTDHEHCFILRSDFCASYYYGSYCRFLNFYSGRVGDQILAVDGQILTGKTHLACMSILRGTGKSVHLLISRPKRMM